MCLRDYFRASAPSVRPRRTQLALPGTAAAVKEGKENAHGEVMCAGSKSSTNFYPPVVEEPGATWKGRTSPCSLILRISE